ncbi:MAG: hypothetical protein J1G38_07525 [Clostridiales bacterium]|nr:hypothetical protein [Clostridiales bacterium]
MSESSPIIGSNIAVIIILALLTVATILALVVALCRYAEKKDAKKKLWILPTVLAVGFVIRLIFALCIRGYRPDYDMFTDMFDDLAANGVYGYYKGSATATLYPVTYFIYLIFGGLSNAMGLSGDMVGKQFLVKLPMMLADLAAAYCIYRLACKYFNAYVGYALAAFVCLCPIFFIGSALWATPIVFTVTFILYACYFLARKKYAATIAFATAAAFSSKEGIYLFPVVVVFCVYHFVRAIINIRRDGPSGKTLLSSDYCAAFTVPAAFILSVLGAYLIGLFMFAGYSYNIFIYIYEFLLEPLVDWSYFTYNGLSVYALFGQNGAEPQARFPAWVFVGIFLAIVLAVVCVVYFTKRNRATMVMLASYVLVTLQIYYAGSSAIGMVSCLPVILAAYALVRDKRLLYVLFVMGLAFVINSSVALASAGYMNNLLDHELDASISTLMSDGFAAVPIVFSAFAFIAHLYYTYVAVSVGMSGQKRMLNEAHGIGDSLKELFSAKREG